jgi:CTD small phosphatase-like protein 2
MHLIQTLQSLQYVKQHLTSPPHEEIFRKRVVLPPFKQPWITKTIVFDLDETLVHCIEDYMNKNVDQLIQVKFPSGDIASAGINIRPFAFECLKRAS